MLVCLIIVTLHRGNCVFELFSDCVYILFSFTNAYKNVPSLIYSVTAKPIPHRCPIWDKYCYIQNKLHALIEVSNVPSCWRTSVFYVATLKSGMTLQNFKAHNLYLQMKISSEGMVSLIRSKEPFWYQNYLAFPKYFVLHLCNWSIHAS